MMSKNVEFQDTTRKFVYKPNIFNPSESEDGDYMEISNSLKDGVRCNRCNKMHLLESRNEDTRFITIHGNIHVNNGGGVLGNADWDEHKVPVYHYCPKCLVEDVLQWAEPVRKPKYPHLDAKLATLPSDF